VGRCLFFLRGSIVPRYAVFVDEGYVRPALKSFSNPPPNISYQKLAEAFRGQDELLRMYVYDCAPFQSAAPTDEERARKAKFDSFRSQLEHLPRTEVRLERLARRPAEQGTGWKFEQKQVDVLLTVDLVRLSFTNQIQRAVIVGCDSDFVPAIQAAKDAGVIVQLCYCPNTPPNNEILQKCDDRIPFDKTFLDSIRV
jgi:uncharacterized LabA/DUF88 family protein